MKSFDLSGVKQTPNCVPHVLVKLIKPSGDEPLSSHACTASTALGLVVHSLLSTCAVQATVVQDHCMQQFIKNISSETLLEIYLAADNCANNKVKAACEALVAAGFCR